MAINKVVHQVHGTLMDISQDTVTASVLIKGYTAHGANGELIEGTHNGGVKEVAEFPSEDVDTGLIYKVHDQITNKYTLYMYLNDDWVQFITVSNSDNNDKPIIAAGLYTDNTYSTMTTSWQDLLDTEVVHVDNGVVYTNADLSTMQNGSATSLVGVLVLPDDGSVTALGDFDMQSFAGNAAFAGCAGLTNVIVPSTVTTISDAAFYYCTGLTEINIPNGVMSIGERVFHSCTSLSSVTIPDSVTHIEVSAFNGCSALTSVTIPDSVTHIDDHAFSGCANLTSVTFGENSQLAIIGLSAFHSCESLSEIEIPTLVTSIGSTAFSGCINLTSIEIPYGVMSIGNYTFDRCFSLTSVTIPDSVTNIGDGAFASCTSLSSVTIPDSVSVIDYEVFSGCSALTSVTIPNSVTSIRDHAFSGCVNLTSVTFEGTVNEWNSITIGVLNFGNVTEIQCSDGTVNLN